MIKKQDIPNMDLNSIPDGANVIYGVNNKPEAVVMSLKYYSKLQALIKKVKELIGKKSI